MIKEAYCSKKVSELLKEKGFNIPIWTRYESNNDSDYEVIFGDKYDWNNSPMGQISAPTHQMAIAWLRRKGIAIIPIISSILDNEKFLWNVNITIAKTGETYTQGWRYEEYKNVVDDALEYCLENFI